MDSRLFGLAAVGAAVLASTSASSSKEQSETAKRAESAAKRRAHESATRGIGDPTRIPQFGGVNAAASED
eukprot:5527220-Karenia_brevis.AAC.1